MLDINLIRTNPDFVKNALLKRMDHVDFTEILELDKNKRELILKGEQLKAKKNEVSSNIPKLKKAGQDICELLKEMKVVGDSIKEIDTELNSVSQKLNESLDALPNMPADDVVAGDKENNEVIRTWGTKPEFAFKPSGHMDIAEKLGLIDYERGVKLGGTGFWIYKGDGALL